MRPLRKLGFLTIGLFEESDPRRGHESTLEIIELGEQLGFDSVWVRHRHLQFGISSPVAVLAAASQRTRRIHLGTAVIPLGWDAAHRNAAGASALAVRARSRRDVRAARRTALGSRRLPPRSTRWRSPFPSPRARGLRPDPHRYRHQARTRHWPRPGSSTGSSRSGWPPRSTRCPARPAPNCSARWP